MQFGSSNSLLLRLALSSSISVIKLSTPRRAISVLVSSYSSSSSSCNQFTSRRIHNEEDSKSIRVSVWWDFENCHLPAGANVFKLVQTITSAIRINGVKGPISITAFGDLVQLSRTNQEALFETGINLTHVPQGGKNSTDRSLITDLMYWVSQNPPPAHLFLISSDRDFASMLHRLRMNNYNILLAGKEEATPSVLCSAATIMWDWEALVRGKIFTGKHFNHPPDGPYNSWYGHYTTPLLNPYATIKQQSCTSMKTADSEEVVKQISLILRCYPKGVPITELRVQLSKRNVWLDRHFYGHKNFSSFLLSMPKILQVVPVGDDVFLIHAVTQGMDNEASFLKRSSENHKVVSVESMRQKMNDEDVKVESHPQVRSQKSVLVINQMDVKSNDESMKENQRALVVGNGVSSSKVKDGFFKKLTKKWFGSPDKDLESRIASCTSNESAMEFQANREVGNEKSKGPGLLRLLKRYKFSWGRNTKLSNARATGPPLVDEFSKDFSWKNLKSFNNSPRGFVVSYSRSREAMAKNLKDEGLSSLKPLVLSKMLALLSLVISEKKWTKESSCDASVTQFTEKSFDLTNPRSSVELKSVLVNMVKSQSDEASGEYKSKNIALNQKPIERSRSEVIADCNRLIKKITEENPGGYNMGNFRKDFRERIGYPLDFYNLGYSKLQSLIQTMPEVKIELGHIVPSSMHESDSSPIERSRSEVIADCHGLIKKITEENPGGYHMGNFRKDFRERIGYPLDLYNLGYSKLQSLIQTMPEVKIESGHIVPSSMHESDSSFEELGPVSGKIHQYESSDSVTNEDTCLKQFSDYERKKQKDNETKSELPQILGDFDKKQKKNLEEGNFDSDIIEEACLKQCSDDKRKKHKDNTKS